MSKVSSPLLQKQVKPLGPPEMMMYALGFGAGSLVNLGFGTYLSFFWSDIAMIPLAAIGTIFAVSRLLDGGTDIFIGFMVDRTKTKYGKARPWLLWMALPGAISLSMLYYVPNFSESGKIIYAFVTYNLVAFFILTATTLPLQSILALITDDPKKRLNMSMLNNIVGTSFTVLSNMFVLQAIEKLGGGKDGYFKFFGMLAVVAAIMYIVAFLGTNERVQPAKGREKDRISVREALSLFVANKWWVVITIFQTFSFLYPSFMAINMYYMTWVMRDPSLMGPFMSAIFTAMLVVMILAAPIVPRVGKINAAFAAMFTQMIGNFLPLIIPGSVPALMVAAVFRGAGPAILLGTSGAFMCDVVEYGEWHTGRRVEGLVFSAASMGGKIGAGLGGLVVAFLLARGGYVGGASAQTPQALGIITFIFTWCHAFGSIVCTILLFFLRKLDAQMPQIMADLEARRNSTVS
ncbi:MAG: glycoside-pentoside-hexuronide (GPH):cation symporter [Firmicutes bacterium]|nr:glycoside-pentoside-hexuronide (GPH):cation symporter [Bacillota bacterium]